MPPETRVGFNEEDGTAATMNNAKAARGSSVTSEPTINDMMAAYAQDAVDHAKENFQLDLDFSTESVREVEETLASMFSAIPKGLLARIFGRAPSDEVIWSFAKMYGGYIGEVLRRAGGGEWFIDEDVAPGMLGLRKADHRIWPPAKVGKRLTNGPEDNVWHYFIVVSEDW